MGSLRPSSRTAVTDFAIGRSARMITPSGTGVRAEHRVRVVVLARDDPFDLAQAEVRLCHGGHSIPVKELHVLVVRVRQTR